MALSDSPFAAHPNFDPQTDAIIAAWVLLTTRRDWSAMTETEQASAYLDFFVNMSDEDVDDFYHKRQRPT